MYCNIADTRPVVISSCIRRLALQNIASEPPMEFSKREIHSVALHQALFELVR